MSKYKTLLNILDNLRYEAPKEYKSYRPAPLELDKLNHARSKALLHLFLKVGFGILDFKERERLITDGSNDAGIDAYYIDEDNKEVLFIQANLEQLKKTLKKRKSPSRNS